MPLEPPSGAWAAYVQRAEEEAINTKTTPLAGMKFFTPPAGSTVCGLDGKVTLTLDGLPIPLLQEDLPPFDGGLPSYDAVGRGIYQALRLDPDSPDGPRFAALLKGGYPHFVSELASHIIMLGEKEVDVPYLERRVNYLKIFALMEPENPRFPLEIGTALLEMGVHLSALQRCTVTLFKAESFLRQGLRLSPADLKGISSLGEVCYLLGKYEEATSLWQQVLPQVSETAAAALAARLEKMAKGEVPKVPAVDYLQAIAGALCLKDEGEYPEAVAILTDIMGDANFSSEFPMPQIPYLLALCCLDMNAKEDARLFLLQALKLNPDYPEAQSALEQLEG